MGKKLTMQLYSVKVQASNSNNEETELPVNEGEDSSGSTDQNQ